MRPLILIFIFFMSYQIIGQTDILTQAQIDLVAKSALFKIKKDDYNSKVQEYNNLKISQESQRLRLQASLIDVEKEISQILDSAIIAYKFYNQEGISKDKLNSFFLIPEDLSDLSRPYKDQALEIEFSDDTGLISSKAYAQKISKDFSYLILGENSPQQGLSATLNEKGSSIKLNGLLRKGLGSIISLEADLASTNGVYFFDEEKGGQKGKITVNYIKTLKGWSFYTPNENTKEIIHYQIEELVETAYSDYYNLYNLLKKATSDGEDPRSTKGLNETDVAQEKEVNKTICTVSESYINIQQAVAFNRLKVRPFKEIPYEKGKDNKGKTTYNTSKIRKELADKSKYITESLEQKIIAVELKEAASSWTIEHLTFYGFSPFYQRESFKRFTYDSTLTFNEMFNDERGDIYGGSIFFSHNITWGKTRTRRAFARATTAMARASNISTFSNSTLNFTSPVGNDAEGNPIVLNATNTAFTGNATYEYGTSNSFNIEAYIYPFNIPIGFFGNIGYEYINFSRKKDVTDKELSPLRAGIIYNIANKTKDKPLLVLQAFFDRTDLSLSPNGNDDDLRFGFGIGLPINLKQ
ncbi:hypothetical protein EAX61_08800 [Dokdonia sinensis]|uniref:Uncharacterized protein n=1 Tax=Dokdonia sinensis TaxID=2479847 RepID=A0A3M0GDD5_9FLAO|nr:hypothetical protein [Dokdonia sinensis]RMB59149.1 hypothetical protein EAX61_08800 [Dokdonia sinensis]